MKSTAGGSGERIRGTAGHRSPFGRLSFAEPAMPESPPEEIGRERFFRIFDENDLAFLRQDECGSGKTSRFDKSVDR